MAAQDLGTGLCHSTSTGRFTPGLQVQAWANHRNTMPFVAAAARKHERSVIPLGFTAGLLLSHRHF